MQTPATHHKPGLAVTLKIVAVFLFMVMAAMIKAAADDVPAGQALFFRAIFSLPAIFLWLWWAGNLREGLIPKKLSSHIWRGLFGTTAMGLTFFGLIILPLPEVVT